jgi:hypothetical protein
MANIVPVIPEKKRLQAGHMCLAEQRRKSWVAIPDPDTAYSEVFFPDYWETIAAKLRPFDTIEVWSDDGSYWAELLVLTAGKTQATVRELRKIDISPSERSPAEETFAVKWRGPASKWGVIPTALNRDLCPFSGSD